jgi:transposase-like protein
MEVEEHTGASRHERSPGRIGRRNGYCQGTWDTRVGGVELSVPRVRDSSYFPSLLEPCRKAEGVLAAVVQEPHVSELCEELHEEVERVLLHPGTGNGY